MGNTGGLRSLPLQPKSPIPISLGFRVVRPLFRVCEFQGVDIENWALGSDFAVTWGKPRQTPCCVALVNRRSVRLS